MEIKRQGKLLSRPIWGVGKTQKSFEENKNKFILGLSYENAAVDNLRNYCEKFNVRNYKCMTIHHALNIKVDENGNQEETERKPIDFNKYEVIIFDEINRTDPSSMTKIYIKLLNYNGKLIMMG